MWVKVVLFGLILKIFDCCSETISQVGTRIVGGTLASINEFPYQVSIQVGATHICGGALVAPYLVLSAGHCFAYSSMPEVYNVRVGSNITSSGGQLVKVTKITVHENYKNLVNDIAVLELSKNVTLSFAVQIINISTSDDYTAGSIGTVSGWGHDKENGTISTHLMSVNIPLTTIAACATSYKDLATITSSMICAGYPTGGKDACQGDSGGPLVQNKKLIGLVSFGMGCARTYPGVYTNVARYIDWITKNSNLTTVPSDNSTCDSIWCSLFNGDQSKSFSSVLLIGSVIGSTVVNILFG